MKQSIYVFILFMNYLDYLVQLYGLLYNSICNISTSNRYGDKNMDNLNQLLNTLEQYLQFLMSKNNSMNPEVIVSCISVVSTAMIGIISILLASRNSNKEFKQKVKEKEPIRKSLEEFYYPVTYLLGANTQLYKCFALKEKSENNDFRTLNALINKHIFCPTDQKILEKIIDVNQRINELILEKGLYVQNDEIREELVQLSTHYTVIELAYEGKIEDINDEYNKWVFPRNIHDHLNVEIRKMEEKLK